MQFSMNVATPNVNMNVMGANVQMNVSVPNVQMNVNVGAPMFFFSDPRC